MEPPPREEADAVDTLHKLWELKEAQKEMVQSEDFMPAHINQQRQNHLRRVLEARPGDDKACKTCGIAKPSLAARGCIRESWRGLTCWFCRGRQQTRDDAVGSLSLRIHVELSEAKTAMMEVRGYETRKFPNVTRVLKATKTACGPGQGFRGKGAEDSLSLVGLLQRTRARIIRETALRGHADAFDEALELLGVE